MRNFILVLSIVFSISGCVGVKVQSTSAPNVDLQKYQTFCWFQYCDIKYDGPEYGFNKEGMQILQQMIKTELESKGLINDPKAPDLLVGFHVTQKIKKDNPKYKEIMTPYDQDLKYWKDYESYFKSISEYLDGSLVINFIDANTSSIVWQTTAHHYLNLKTSGTIGKDMKKKVKKALKDYPFDQKTFKETSN